MAEGEYTNTISGLLRKRSELMAEAQRLREATAVVSNDIESIERVLAVLGYGGDLKGVAARSSRIVYFHRNELRRFVLEKLREAKGETVSSRSLAETILSVEGKDSRDRQVANDMVRRVGKALKLLREQGVVVSERGKGELVWRLRA